MVNCGRGGGFTVVPVHTCILGNGAPSCAVISVTLQQCYQVLKLKDRKKSWFISPSVTVFLSSHLINACGQKSGNSLCLLKMCFHL